MTPETRLFSVLNGACQSAGEHSATTKVVQLLGKPAHWRAWRPRGHSAPFGRRRSRRCGPDRGTCRKRTGPIDPRAKDARRRHRNPARLGRVGRINLDDLATSTFSLVREMGDKVGPTRIQDAHGETAGNHGGNPEIFEHDPIESRDQFVDEVVEEVFPYIGHMDHQALQSQGQPATVAAAEHAPCDLPLEDAQLPENPAIPSGVFFLLPIAERGQSHEPEIDADRFPSLRQRLRLLDLAGEGDEPLARPAEDTGRLDRPFELAVPADGDPADAKEVEATAIDLKAVAVLLVAEPRESIPDLEPGIAGILPGLDPAKERLERLVQVGHDVLENVAVDVQSIGTGGFLHLDLAKLNGLGDRLAAFLVSLFSLAAASIVEVAA